MKKTLFSLLAILSVGSLYSQSGNGGQFAESSSLKVALDGTSSNYQAIIKVTNKQNCQVSVKFNHNSANRNKTIPALGSDTFRITLPECNVKVKPLTNCGCDNTDMGWVELNVCQALPVKFVSFTATRLTNDLTRIQLVVEEDASIHHYAVKISTDGINFKEVDLIFPNGIEGMKQYTFDIKTNK